MGTNSGEKKDDHKKSCVSCRYKMVLFVGLFFRSSCTCEKKAFVVVVTCCVSKKEKERSDERISRDIYTNGRAKPATKRSQALL